MSEYSLAKRLRVARAYKGWSQTELAKRAGVHHVMISKLERGATKDIQGATLRKLCEALAVNPQYLLGMSNDMTSQRETAGREPAPV
jgi:transcriptional regulator with XRE-family HTH domain